MTLIANGYYMTLGIFLKLEGEINPNIDFESWLNSIDYKEYIEKLAMKIGDSVTESEVDDDRPF